MARRKDFTQEDQNRYSGIIGAVDAKEAKEAKKPKAEKKTKETNATKDIKPSKGIPGRKSKGYLDPDYSPEEWKFTARMPGIYGRFINELAYQHRTTIKAELQRIVKEEMERHPEVLEAFDELNQ